MYRSINNIEPTIDPRFFTAKVNLWNTKEKAQIDINEYINDPILLDIETLINYFLLRKEFTIMAFDDKFDPLKNLGETGKNEYWALVYKCPYITSQRPGYTSSSSPSHETYLKYLLHYTEKYPDEKGGVKSFLFEQTVKNYIYETTSNESEHIKSRRFKMIENSFFIPKDTLLTKEEFTEYFKELYESNIFEVMFRDFK